MGFFDRLHFDNHYATLAPEFFTRLPPTPLPDPDPYFVAALPDFAVPAPRSMTLHAVSGSS